MNKYDSVITQGREASAGALWGSHERSLLPNHWPLQLKALNKEHAFSGHLRALCLPRNVSGNPWKVRCAFKSAWNWSMLEMCQKKTCTGSTAFWKDHKRTICDVEMKSAECKLGASMFLPLVIHHLPRFFELYPQFGEVPKTHYNDILIFELWNGMCILQSYSKLKDGAARPLVFDRLIRTEPPGQTPQERPASTWLSGGEINCYVPSLHAHPLFCVERRFSWF